jgi:pyruvate,water dikinase
MIYGGLSPPLFFVFTKPLFLNGCFNGENKRLTISSLPHILSIKGLLNPFCFFDRGVKKMNKYIRWFSDIRATDVPLVGGKNASLGEMYSQLDGGAGVPVPNGFAITRAGFDAFLTKNNLALPIIDLVREFSPEKKNLSEIGNKIRSLIEDGEVPEDLEKEMTSAYRTLSGDTDIGVAVRSSATVEDNPKDSFAGQFETFLNVSGEHALLLYVKKCFASLFTDRGISYRQEKGYDPLNTGLSVGVQKMVRSDKGASGVMFTLDTESGFRDVIFIQSSYGLGEMVVQGAVNPDTFYVFKPMGALVRKILGSKKEKMIYAHGRSELTHIAKTSSEERDRFSLAENEVLTLSKYALAIERHYGRPMDIEWAKDGIDGKLYIVQARPETVKSREVSSRIRTQYVLSKEKRKVIVSGGSVGERIACGTAQVILGPEDMDQFTPGGVLVTDMTDPGWEPIMRKASAIVTNRGGRTCHAAIIARELGIPAVVGCTDATKNISNRQMITVSCAEGEVGYIYDGKVSFVKEEVDVSNLQRPKQTQIMLNVADPTQAFSLAVKYGDLVYGVGLLRLELLLNKLGVHPRAITDYGSLKEETRAKIDLLTKGYKSPRDYYVSQIAEGVATIAAAFYPNPVIVRLSDFKTNEYRKLLCGDVYERHEENPMIGFRGASRYPHADFIECFNMECEAIYHVRYGMGLHNIKVMVPFVRTPDEGKRVLELLAQNGLKQEYGAKEEFGVQIICMCEIPSNIIRADEFLALFDGFSIGSNDLTQLTLGVDRDSGVMGAGLDERDPAVLWFMKTAAERCKHAGKYIGICGQAPSDYREITDFLVRCGVDSLSLNPDSVFKMLEVVAKAEKELGL